MIKCILSARASKCKNQYILSALYCISQHNLHTHVHYLVPMAAWTVQSGLVFIWHGSRFKTMCVIQAISHLSEKYTCFENCSFATSNLWESVFWVQGPVSARASTYYPHCTVSRRMFITTQSPGACSLSCPNGRRNGTEWAGVHPTWEFIQDNVCDAGNIAFIREVHMLWKLQLRLNWVACMW